ncbi:MAG: colanic acid biosynthesis glycosyltransferase WcaL [Deltaproteobacteria bacterium]|nr:colanic acid biosynthesis glycosyltransferase WcaL [Deltaproteobacteria bacterium]MBP2682153.1 colanic acid biosynthesis glycosyltransferase WcaL [Deltaproteobacteria bacterium]
MGADRLVVVHSFPVWLPQTQTWMFNQVRYLPENIEAHVVCDSTENLDQFGLPRIHSLSAEPRWRRSVDYRLRRCGARRHSGFLARQARSVGARILHSHFGNVGWQDIGAARAAGARHVVSFYGYDASYLPARDPEWRGRYRELFARVDRILCEGPHMGRSVESLGCPAEKARVHHLGVRLDEIPFVPRVLRPGEPLRVLIAASFQEKKGIPYAIEALGRLSREFPVELTIVGDANEEERSRAEKGRILDALERHVMKTLTRMPGYRTHAALFEEAFRHHVFLSPSVTAGDGDTEGGAPVTLIEMAATGMPVVATRHCDIPEIVRHGETGFLAPERDAGALVENLRWLVAHPAEWERIARTARLHIEAEYDVVRQGERLAAIYRELAG